MCRQLISPEEWEQHAGDSELGDRMEWSNRACGMAALRMILLAYGRPAPTVTELVKLGVARNALTPRGWLHAGIADIANDLGVPAQAEPVTADNLVNRITSAPMIISVTETLPTDGRKGGHLIVAHGYTDNGDADTTIYFRDPSAWGQTHDLVALDRLTASYSGRAITFAPITEEATA
jgi:hypothetical protein